LIIKGEGYDKFQTILYTAPSGAVQITLLWIGVLCCWALPSNRTLVALALVIPPLIGNISLLELYNVKSWGIIVAAWLSSCITAPWSILLSLTASNVKGNTKRAVVSAAFFIGYAVGCIASPQLWTQSPRYYSGVVCAIVTWCLLFCVILGYRFTNQHENKRREKAALERTGIGAGQLETGSSGDVVLLDETGAAKSDLTDKQDKEFRYSI
jgi:hypothetical protein